MNDDLHIVPEHDICPCTSRENYENMMRPSMVCRQVPDLEARLQYTEKRLDTIEKHLKIKKASEGIQKP